MPFAAEPLTGLAEVESRAEGRDDGHNEYGRDRAEPFDGRRWAGQACSPPLLAGRRPGKAAAGIAEPARIQHVLEPAVKPDRRW